MEMRGKNLRIVAYTIFIIGLLLLAQRFVLLFPIGGWSHGGNPGIIDKINPITLSWDPSMRYIGVYGKSYNETNPWYEFMLWNWKDEFPREENNKIADWFTFRLYNSPQFRTDTKWSPLGSYIAETFNTTSSEGRPLPAKTFLIRQNNEFVRLDNSVPLDDYSTLAWYPDESKLLLANFNASLFSWDLNNNETLTKIPTNLVGNIRKMEISSKSDYMFSYESRNETYVLSVSPTGSQLGYFQEILHSSKMTWVQWMSILDNELLFFENETQIYTYNPLTHEISQFLTTDVSLMGAFAGKSQYLGYVQNNTLFIYDFSLQKFLDPFVDENPIYQVAISPDEQYIAYVTSEGIYVRSLTDYALIKYLPPGEMTISGSNYIGLKTFQTMEVITLFIVFGVLELFIGWIRKRKMKRYAELSDSNLYPDVK